MMDNTVLERCPGVTFRLNVRSGDLTGKAFDATNDILHEFTEEGAAILRLIDGETSVAQIAATLAATFDAPVAVIRTDVDAFIGQCIRLDLIRERGAQ